MSGDVQPRKRKDKKRRKDEGEQIPIQTHAPAPTNPPVDDINIHVHKESGTGGGICAKLVFFVLLSALMVVIGMIITQYRGLTDVETVDTESRFSQIFEGWIDSSPDHHEDHNIEEKLDHDVDHDDEDDEHDLDDDEEEELSEEEEDEEEEGNDEDTEVSEERNEVDDDEEDEDEDEEDDVDSEENKLDDDEEEEEDEDEVEASEEEKETYESEEKDEDDDEDEDHEEDEQELENIGSEEDKLDDVSTEKLSGEDEDDDDDDEEETDDDDAEAEQRTTSEKKVETRDVGDDTGETPQESSGGKSMAVKLGVGVALLVVAHLVLVKKWRTAPDDKPKPPKEDPSEPVPDLARRNTIVVPPTFQEVEPDIEPEEEDYSEEELSEEEVHEVKSAKTRYQELRSTYTRSLTPEGEIDYHKPPAGYDDDDEENIDEEEEEEEEVSEEEDRERRGEDSEEEDDEEEEYDDDEDEELLKRLEAKYGKLREGERRADVEHSDSEKSDDDAAGYEYSNITNKDDYKIKSDIDEAQKSVQNNSAYAIKLFDKLLQKYPSSPRSIYGKALALDYLADQRRSNDILEQALKFYTQLFNTRNVPDALFEMAAERCINRMRFVGQYRNAINVHKLLIQKFSNNPKHRNDLAVTYLTINRVEEARSVLKQILSTWPNNGFALVHFGFILKTSDNKLEEAVDYLRRGLETRAEGVIDGRFYFHLGDSLARLGRNDEAMKVYEEGVTNKVFLSKYQRSLYNVPRLTGRPWWDLADLPYQDLFRQLKQSWKKIRDEGLAVLNEKGYFQDESENLKDTGDWKQFELFARGQKNTNNCKACPFTCTVIERIPEARNCKRGQTKFSVMHPGTHVWPHCGPTNCRLRAHLGLKVPPKTFIRVADETRSWKEGEVFVFDDSFEHEVWHNGTEFRLVLIVDIWHPDLTAAEKRGLSPI